MSILAIIVAAQLTPPGQWECTKINGQRICTRTYSDGCNTCTETAGPLGIGTSCTALACIYLPPIDPTCQPKEGEKVICKEKASEGKNEVQK